MDLAAILAATRHPWAASTRILRHAASTNDEALEASRQGAPHGTVILARSQTAGRGRLGRIWESRPGDSLCLSVLIHPAQTRHSSPRLTLAAGLAVHRALTTLTGLPLHIKWPNDLLWEEKKLCGILTESGSASAGLDYAVIGIGINLNQKEADFSPDLRSTACSLLGLTGRSWDADETAAAVLHALTHVLQEPWESVLAAWKSHCTSLGRTIRLQTPSGPRSGVLLDIAPDGALVFLETAQSTPQLLHSAEIL